MQNSRVRLFWIWYQCVLPGYGNRSQRYMAKMHSICDTRLSINLWFYMCSYILLFTYAFLHIILSIAQICMGGIIFHRNYFFPRIICLLPSAVPDPARTCPCQDIRILFYMHLCVNIHMHDLMYTCVVQMKQRVELFFNHITIFPIAAHERCSLVTWAHVTWHSTSLISPYFLTCVINMS